MGRGKGGKLKKTTSADEYKRGKLMTKLRLLGGGDLRESGREEEEEEKEVTVLSEGGRKGDGSGRGKKDE